MATNGLPSIYACPCLNVQVRPHPAQGDPPATHDEFEPVYAGDEGISVTHTQLTLRTRLRPESDERNARSIRYVSLTCLICHCMVYRVQRILDPEVDNGEGPVLPADDWAERDLLKSGTGWVEVSKGCSVRVPVPQSVSRCMHYVLHCILDVCLTVYGTDRSTVFRRRKPLLEQQSPPRTHDCSRLSYLPAAPPGPRLLRQFLPLRSIRKRSGGSIYRLYPCYSSLLHSHQVTQCSFICLLSPQRSLRRLVMRLRNICLRSQRRRQRRLRLSKRALSGRSNCCGVSSRRTWRLRIKTGVPLASRPLPCRVADLAIRYGRG